MLPDLFEKAKEDPESFKPTEGEETKSLEDPPDREQLNTFQLMKLLNEIGPNKKDLEDYLKRAEADPSIWKIEEEIKPSKRRRKKPPPPKVKEEDTTEFVKNILKAKFKTQRQSDEEEDDDDLEDPNKNDWSEP